MKGYDTIHLTLFILALSFYCPFDVLAQKEVYFTIDLSGAGSPNPDLYGFHVGAAVDEYEVNIPPLTDLSSDDKVYEWFTRLSPNTLRFPVGSQAKWTHLMSYDDVSDTWYPSRGFGYNMAQIAQLYSTFLSEDLCDDENMVKKIHNSKMANSSYLDRFIQLCKDMESASGKPINVLFVANVISAIPEENVEVVKYLQSKEINVVGVELGNELYFQKFYKHFYNTTTGAIACVNTFNWLLDGVSFTGEPTWANFLYQTYPEGDCLIDGALYEWDEEQLYEGFDDGSQPHGFITEFKCHTDPDISSIPLSFPIDRPNITYTKFDGVEEEIGDIFSNGWNAIAEDLCCTNLPCGGKVYDAISIHPYFVSNPFFNNCLEFDVFDPATYDDPFNYTFADNDEFEDAFNCGKNEVNNFCKSTGAPGFEQIFNSYKNDFFDISCPKNFWVTEWNMLAKDDGEDGLVLDDYFQNTYLQGSFIFKWYLKMISYNLSATAGNPIQFATFQSLHQQNHQAIISPKKNNYDAVNPLADDPGPGKEDRKRVTYFAMDLLKTISTNGLQIVNSAYAPAISAFNIKTFIDSSPEKALYVYFENSSGSSIDFYMDPLSGLPPSCTTVVSKKWKRVFADKLYSGQGYNTITAFNDAYGPGGLVSSENLGGFVGGSYGSIELKDETTSSFINIPGFSMGYIKVLYDAGCTLKNANTIIDDQSNIYCYYDINNGQLTVKNPKGICYNLRILNLFGQEVLCHNNLNQPINQFSISSSQAIAMYFYKIQSNGKPITNGKFISVR